MIPEKKTTIFVDGDCIVCDVEIAHYKRAAPDLFQLVDISSPDFKAADFGLTKEAVNKNLHVMTPEGDLKVGVEAFAHIWSRIRRYSIAGRFALHPLVRPLAEAGYKAFTTVRPHLPRKKR